MRGLELHDVRMGGRLMRYPSRLPTPDEIPAGWVIVHNHVVPPVRRLGHRGFRAWLEVPGDRLVACGCSWAPELDEHYRVARRDG
jgi:hypothetical protein